MPKHAECDCQVCIRFRANMPESRLTNESRAALERANMPKKKKEKVDETN